MNTRLFPNMPSSLPQENRGYEYRIHIFHTGSLRFVSDMRKNISQTYFVELRLFKCDRHLWLYFSYLHYKKCPESLSLPHRSLGIPLCTEYKDKQIVCDSINFKQILPCITLLAFQLDLLSSQLYQLYLITIYTFSFHWEGHTLLCGGNTGCYGECSPLGTPVTHCGVVCDSGYTATLVLANSGPIIQNIAPATSTGFWWRHVEFIVSI